MWLVATALLVLQSAALAAEPKLVGTPAPDWLIAKSDWQNSPPLSLAQLRGKVVLIRWWTAPTCPFCKASAPALNAFHKKYAASGLQVVGFYHHKADTRLEPVRVKEWAADFGFKFPVAIDRNWRTLRRFWLDHDDQAWTSVSFLLDRKGVIRHIHPGGQYVEGDLAHVSLQKAIETLLAEKD